MSEKPVNQNEKTPADSIFEKIKEIKEGKNGNKEEKVIKEENITEENTNISEETEKEEIKNTEKELSETKKEDIKNNTEEKEKENKPETEDFSSYNKEQLVEKLNTLLKEEYKPRFDKTINKIKEIFYKIIKSEQEELKNKFITDGGKEEDFEPVKTEIENKFKELVQKLKDKKETFEIKLEEEKKKNLTLKYNIIDQIKELINKPESFTKTFAKFKELQKKWNEIGLIPKNEIKNLQDEYKIQVQKFYEYVEISKELRELDFKKNYELKKSLCEKAEELLLETDYNKAKKELQILHKKWKEAGAVSNEVREELWARFQKATIEINDRYSKFLGEIREQEQKNLESKQFLVEKAEELANAEYTNHSEWKDASDKVIELQKLWKRIGYVPREFNNKIYNQFKTACDLFFERIRNYYEETEKDREDNYQKKLDLCTQAESLQESTEWVKTAEIYKQIQEEWKKIGPVPKKYSDEIWKRFRKACNTFFDRKKEHYKNRKAAEKENLIKKQEVIEKIKNLELTENQNENIKKLKELQNEFISIGYVPFENKDEIYDKFHDAVNEQFEKLNISKEKLEELKFSENLENIKQSPDADFLLQKEATKVQKQIDKLQDDIKIWENNIGFFSSSSSKSDSLIKNLTDKIEKAKNKLSSLKIKMKKIQELQSE